MITAICLVGKETVKDCTDYTVVYAGPAKDTDYTNCP